MCVYLNKAKLRDGWGSMKAGLEEHGHLDSLCLSSEGLYHHGQTRQHVLCVAFSGETISLLTEKKILITLLGL